jgi:hypothetical protein
VHSKEHSLVLPQIGYFVLRYTKEKLPKLFAHFKSLECEGSVVKLMTTEWFLCIFCKSLPIETAFRIWDMFFYDGPKVIFRAALSILKICEEELLKAKNELELVSRLAELTNDMFDADKIIDTCFSEFRSISRAELFNRRKIEHQKMVRTVNSEASQAAFARMNQVTGISEKAAHSLLADFEEFYQSSACVLQNQGQMFSTTVDYVSFSTVSRSLFKWAEDCFTLENNAGASARTAMLLLFQALGGDTLLMSISFVDMVIGFWQLIFGTPEERVKIAFNFFDTDRSGSLKRANVQSVLPAIQVLLSHLRTSDSAPRPNAATPEALAQADALDPNVIAQSVPEEVQLQLGNIEFCQKYLSMLFGEAVIAEKTAAEKAVVGPQVADQLKEIDFATFSENVKSVAIIVEFFYLNRAASRTIRSLLWLSSFEDELSFVHFQKFALNFDRNCSMLLAMVKAEQWPFPKEEQKKSGFFFFSPKKLDNCHAQSAECHDALEFQFSGKALVDYVLRIQW